ncbi:hypothetical protein AAFF_G00228660 [Aldrovandia affinis]|uniref:Uncharacterized protein n=1 Tax=Aldrovandia affinis TaxID=143900 RepID=A0AAD7SVJ1_9TELE|nr:hypothetical protein AAFF_G00228660 [Aldrovandia affinis]
MCICPGTVTSTRSDSISRREGHAMTNDDDHTRPSKPPGCMLLPPQPPSRPQTIQSHAVTIANPRVLSFHFPESPHSPSKTTSEAAKVLLTPWQALNCH